MIPVRKAVNTLRNGGVGPFIRKTSIYLQFVWHKFGRPYKINVDGTLTYIHIDDIGEISTLKYILEEENDLIEDVLSELRSDDIVWDIGANIGVHTCLFSQNINEVISIEPYPPNTERLNTNIERNNIKNVEVLPIALSDRNGTEKLSVPESESSGDQWPALLPDEVSEDRLNKLKNSHIVRIDVKKGDTLIEEGIHPPSVIKIDVEGASSKVIRGLSNILERGDCRLIYVEVHLPNHNESRPSVEDFGDGPEKIENKLNDYGFDTSIIARRKADFFVKGKK